MTALPRPDRRADGFTLVELLVVIVIVGVLASIAIPTFLRHRGSAYRAALLSDLSSSATAAAAYAADGRAGSYAGLTTVALSVARGRAGSPGVTVTVEASGTDGYCLRAVHESMPGEPMWLDSRAGAPSTMSCAGARY